MIDKHVLRLIADADRELTKTDLEHLTHLSDVRPILLRLTDAGYIGPGSSLQSYVIRDKGRRHLHLPQQRRTPDFLLPRRRRQTQGRVYVMECDGLYKIGWSRDPEQRVRDLAVGNPRSLVLVGMVEGTRGHEARWHKEFADKRLHGEWFRLTPADVERVVGRTDG